MAQPSLFDTEQGDEPGLPPEPTRLRKVPGKVTDQDFQKIQDTLSLKRATMAHWTCPPTTDGEILALICEEWLKAESARLSAKG